MPASSIVTRIQRSPIWSSPQVPRRLRVRPLFIYLPDITSATIPATVETIGNNLFHECPGLADVYCYVNPDNLNWSGYDNANAFMPEKQTQFHVPDTAPWLTKYGDANVTYVGDLSGIHGITTDGATLKGPRYNLSGQRVGNDYKGVVIINGQKQITK